MKYFASPQTFIVTKLKGRESRIHPMGLDSQILPNQQGYFYSRIGKEIFHLSDSVKKISRHPEVVAHLDPLARANLHHDASSMVIITMRTSAWWSWLFCPKRWHCHWRDLLMIYLELFKLGESYVCAWLFLRFRALYIVNGYQHSTMCPHGKGSIVWFRHK